MNTVSNLLDEIKSVLENEVVPGISLYTNGSNADKDAEEMKFFKHDLPLSAEFRGQENKYFPCLIVRDSGGKIATASEPQINTVKIYVQIRDTNPDMSGYEKLIITLDRIRDYFLANGGIRGKYQLVYPIEYKVADDITTPYFLGVLVTRWTVNRMSWNDIEGFL
ncbi:MAG: hypothetical protein Q4G33_06025 [bacterium]|nr:hypothetical protein [bacterium]